MIYLPKELEKTKIRGLERRTLDLTELRMMQPEDEETTQPMIEGHAAVFNQRSEELGVCFPFREKIMPGAFLESIQKDDIRALFNHSPNYVLGRNKAGTLTLEEDVQGLKVQIHPPDTQFARDLGVSIKRGDISQMSIGFQVLTERWYMDNGEDIREITKAKLYDVSPVTFPAYPQTDVSARSINEVWQSHKDEEVRQNKAYAKRQHMKLQQRRYELMEKEALG